MPRQKGKVLTEGQGREVRRLIRERAKEVHNPGLPLIPGRNLPLIIRARSPVGGIASGATVDVKLYDDDHTLGTREVPATNRYTGDVGPDKMIYLVGCEGEYQVLTEDCG